MKLLLTSAGFMNETISDTLLKLAGKPFNELKLAFIPTAANVESGDKGWLITDYYFCSKLQFKEIDIVDISAIPKKMWLPRVKKADVLLFGGGNTFHLMHWLKKSGLDKLLLELLKTRVYVGISAGSMVIGNDLSLSNDELLYKSSYDGLGFIDLSIRPHLNSKWFPNINVENLTKLAKNVSGPIYALDDNSAVVVDENKISVVSEGKWKRFNSHS